MTSSVIFQPTIQLAFWTAVIISTFDAARFRMDDARCVRFTETLRSQRSGRQKKNKQKKDTTKMMEIFWRQDFATR